MGSVSNFVIRWINFLTMILAVGVFGFGVWMGANHDGCRKSVALHIIVLGALIFVVSVFGFLGAWKSNPFLLWIYLIMLFFILVAILMLTVLAFIVTNNGSAHSVNGLRYKEYQLQDYHSWFLKQLNSSHNWERLKSCLVKEADCDNLSKRYKTLKQYKSAKLSPIEAGCCRPPSECGYPARNASYYDLSFHPTSSNKDCKLYKNKRDIKCYNCDSCKAGVAQYMKTEWRVVAIFNLILFIVLSMIYFVGCCARRNAARNCSKV
ncbi:PREDICTED: tetraspanin-10 [Ipomoea nil]|uniref:tetraspanin-10 n=1 Tax=Ipomoea nil TaxID=35883 RepID=UPI000901B8B0|nr:PREDICTED: tetraspanin-10 [Ipomoea nil]